MMEVSGANKSIYFDAETHSRAEKLMETFGITLSQLVRDLINQKYEAQFPAERKEKGS